MSIETCPWCGVQTQPSAGPTHRYLESSPGCWALYGELLAREYQDAQYMAVHGLTVDAYALQHPGQENPQTISSAHVHLASLYVYFSRQDSAMDLAKVKQTVVQQKSKFTWLQPPQDLSEITVADVLSAQSPQQHAEAVDRWARYVFNQWRAHHARIEELLAEVDSN